MSELVTKFKYRNNLQVGYFNRIDKNDVKVQISLQATGYFIRIVQKWCQNSKFGPKDKFQNKLLVILLTFTNWFQKTNLATSHWLL